MTEIADSPAAVSNEASRDRAVAAGQPAHAPQPTNLALLKLCFDESEINDQTMEAAGSAQDSTFDAETFVLNKEQHVSLETLAADLATYGEYLRGALLKSVNEEVHDAFVAVSGQLSLHEQSLRRVHQPILELHGAVDSAREAVDRSKTAVLDHVKEALRAGQEHAFHTTATTVIVCHRRIRFLIATMGGGSSSATAATQPITIDVGAAGKKSADGDTNKKGGALEWSDGTGLVRAIRDELTRPVRLRELATLATKQRHLTQQLQFISSMCNSPDIKEALATISNTSRNDFSDTIGLFRTLFLTSIRDLIKSPSPDAASGLRFSASLFRAVDSEDKLLEFFRDDVVRNVAEEAISWKLAAQARTSHDEVANVVAALRQRLESVVFSVLPLLREVLHSPTSIITVAIWPPVCDTLLKRMMYLFAPGLPAMFHRHFTIANQVLQLVESHCQSLTELSTLRASHDYVLWLRKWSLDVYHTLRQTELTERMNAAFGAPGAFRLSTTAGDASLPSVTAVTQALLWLFDTSTVFLFPLYPKLLRDAQNVTARFLTQATEAAHSGTSMDAIVTCAQCRVLARFVETQLLHTVEAAAQERPPNAAPAPTTTVATQPTTASKFCAFLAAMCRDAASQLLSHVTAAVSQQCLKTLDHVRTIKSAFHMTKKSIPTMPSVFIPNALDPVKEFRKVAADSKVLTETEIRDFTNQILTDVCNKFALLIRDIIVSAKKSQETLDKLKRRKDNNTTAATVTTAAGTAGGDAAAVVVKSTTKPTMEQITDLDKMIVQLYLDIHELGACMRAFGVNKESFAPARNLLALVKRANWILSNFEGPEPVDAFSEESTAAVLGSPMPDVGDA